MKFIHPLQWPYDMPTTRIQRRYADIYTWKQSLKILGEATRRHRDVILMTNYDYNPASGKLDAVAQGTGVIVQYIDNGKKMQFFCDKYNNVVGNLYSIARTIEALELTKENKVLMKIAQI